MDPVTAAILPLTLPASFMTALSFVFQYLKPWLESHARGFHPADASHNDNLRLLFGALCFIAAAIYALTTGGAPHSATAWVTLGEQLVLSAVGMTSGAHILYQQLSGNASGVGSEDSDPNGVYPPSDQDTASVLPPAVASDGAASTPVAAQTLVDTSRRIQS